MGLRGELGELGKNTKRDLKQLYEKVKQYPLISLFFVIALLLLIVIPHWQVSVSGINNSTVEAAQENQNRAILAQIFGGIAIGIGLYFTWKKVVISQDGQITERFTRAVDQLGAIDQKGDPAIEIRLGGIYALERISNESETDYWPIMEILTAYVRKNSSAGILENKKVTPLAMDIQAKDSTISEVPEVRKTLIDIQAVLTVLGKRKYSFNNGEYKRLNLRMAHLEWAELQEAHLEWAHLEWAHLERAHLERAHLDGANFGGASLEGAHLEGAHLEGANLRAFLDRANLDGAELQKANLDGAELQNADLNGANLEEAILRGANLRTAGLKGANLGKANLVMAILWGADLRGADLNGANLKGASLIEASASIPKLIPYFLEKSVISISIKKSSFMNLLRNRSTSLGMAALWGADLRGADLHEADLNGANLKGANLEGANLEGVNLEFALNLTPDQLSNVKTLYKATIDDELLIPLKKYPALFEKPD